MKTKKQSHNLQENVRIGAQTFKLREQINEDTGKLEDVFIEGIAIVFEKPTRNRVSYTYRSGVETYKTLIGKPLLDTHNDTSLRHNPPYGHVVEVNIGTHPELNMPCLFYKASIDPEEEQIIRKIRRKDFCGVSIQVLVDDIVQMEDNGGEYIQANIKEFLELSLVSIPGDLDSSISLAEKFTGKKLKNRFIEKTGGRDKPDEQFNPEQLKKGIEIEMEHTDDPEEAKNIAKDHLIEISDYYDRLAKMEDEAKKQVDTKNSLEQPGVPKKDGTGPRSKTGECPLSKEADIVGRKIGDTPEQEPDEIKDVKPLIGVGQVDSNNMKDEIIAFLKENPNPDDEILHQWAEGKGYDVHEVETIIYTLATDFVSKNEKTKIKKIYNKNETFNQSKIKHKLTEAAYYGCKCSNCKTQMVKDNFFVPSINYEAFQLRCPKCEKIISKDEKLFNDYLKKAKNRMEVNSNGK